MLCCTLTGVLHRHLAAERFDLAVVDEAAQALEAATWGGLLNAPKAVLAGAATALCSVPLPVSAHWLALVSFDPWWLSRHRGGY